MNEIKRKINAIDNLKYSCKEYNLKILPIMEKIKKRDKEYVEDILYELDEFVNHNLIFENLENIVLNATEDTYKILKEIDMFSSFIITDEEDIDEYIDETPFLIEVWLGDYNDKTGVEALRYLSYDILENSKSISEENILYQCISFFKQK